MIVYLAGPITGVKNYKEIFNEAEEKLTAAGYIVINPATLPADMPPEKYMPICLSMLEASDAIVLMPGYDRSRGACLEQLYADYQQKLIMSYKSIVNHS